MHTTHFGFGRSQALLEEPLSANFGQMSVGSGKHSSAWVDAGVTLVDLAPSFAFLLPYYQSNLASYLGEPYL
jgi:hypothetical protein